MTVYDQQARDQPVNAAETVSLAGGQQATITFQLSSRGSRFFMRMLAASKHPDTSYELELDGTNEYGPAATPPTDPDNAMETHTPPARFDRTATVTIANTGSSTLTYNVQLAGWERPQRTDEGGL